MKNSVIGFIVAAFLLVGAGCGGSAGCPYSCSGHGHCEKPAGEWTCVCDTGYAPSARGDECLAANACTGQTCSGHGVCVIGLDKKPACTCESGYVQSADKLSCLPQGGCSVDADCLSPPAGSCQGSTLTFYSTPGTCGGGQCSYASSTRDCGAVGCCQTRCCLIIPSNSADLGELLPTGLDKTASGSFDTVAGCQAGSALGDCALVAPAGVPRICRCLVDRLTIQNLSLSGEAALAVLAYESVTVSGTLSLAGAGNRGGPGARAPAKNEAAGMFGGAGGSNGTAGGNGGAPALNATIIPLAGGQAGQDGCRARAGGGGGGAVQLSAGVRVTVSGAIHAGGGGGQGGNGQNMSECLGGAGGGSGGSVLLEAPEVTVTGSIYANGGAGGGGGNSAGEFGDGGQDAQNSAIAAVGGDGKDGRGCALYGLTQGGNGGAGAVGDVPGGDGQEFQALQCPDTFDKLGGGGGGGGSGRIRINTRNTCDCAGGTFYPTPKTGRVRE